MIAKAGTHIQVIHPEKNHETSGHGIHEITDVDAGVGDQEEFTHGNKEGESGSQNPEEDPFRFASQFS